MTGESWDILFEHYDPDDEKRREALLALGNGALLARAAATTSRCDGRGYPGTYLAGIYDRRPENAAGGQLRQDVLVNLPDWLPLAVRVQGEDAWFSPATAELLQYRHGLDTRRGLSCRDMLLRDGKGRRIWLRERRLVSMVRPRLGALQLELEPLGWGGTLEIRSALDGDVQNANWPQEMPGTHRLLAPCEASQVEPGLLLLRTRLAQSGLAVAVAARNRISGAALESCCMTWANGAISELATCRAADAQVITVEKVAAICTARDPASFEPGEAALDAVRVAPGFAALLSEQELAWERLWEHCRLHAGSPPLQRAFRLHAFHLLQTASQHTIEMDAGFPARGWQEAYSGHVFWDQTFAFPVLALRLPAVARGLLLYRFHRLGVARRAAQQAGLCGAMFPWRSASTGREETPAVQPNPLTGAWLPDNTRLARHVGLTIARDIRTYVLATGDLEFLALYGGELLVEIARFWASLARPTADGRYDIEGVTGPDEYHTASPGGEPGLATNAYTNVLAAWMLGRTPELLHMLPRSRRVALYRALRLSADEIGHWDVLSRRLALAFLGDGVISQFRGYERLQPIDLAQLARSHPGQRADLALQADGSSANLHQIAKQADLLMLPYLLPGAQLRQALERMGYSATDDQLVRTARYYLDRTVHDSSLSRVACAGAMAHLDPAASWQLYNDALSLDLDPATGGGASEGVHLGTMAATLDVMQRIYLGLDVEPDGLVLSPNVPPELPRVEMRLFHRGCALDLEWTGSELRLRSDPANLGQITVRHGGQSRTLRPGTVEAFDPNSADHA